MDVLITGLKNIFIHLTNSLFLKQFNVEFVLCITFPFLIKFGKKIFHNLMPVLSHIFRC